MLKTVIRPHRSALKADTTDEQKVFVMMKLIPSAEIASSRPPLALTLIIDTSASMRAFADQKAAVQDAARAGGGHASFVDNANYQSVDLNLPTLLDQAIEAAHALIDDPQLLPTDSIAIIHFDDDAHTLLPLTPLLHKAQAHQAVEELRNFAGETHLSKGLHLALQEVGRATPDAAKRVFVLTDGAASDEAKCWPLLPSFSKINAPLIGIGFGEEYNEKLLTQMADATQGRPYHLKNMSDLADEVLAREVAQTTREVVTDLRLKVSVVNGVSLDAITRVHPAIIDVSREEQPYRLGNIAAGDYTIFVLEFSIAGIARPASHTGLAQLSLSGNVAGTNENRTLPPHDLVLEFVSDANASGAIDAEVLGYVQQKNVGRLVEDAMRVAPNDPQRARQSLQASSGMTQKLGNTPMTQMLGEALEELDATGQISNQTTKTVSLGMRTKTVKTQALNTEAGGLSPEEIRRLTGT